MEQVVRPVGSQAESSPPLAALLGLFALYLVGLDQGQLLSVVQGSVAFDQNLIHDVDISARHAAGFPATEELRARAGTWNYHQGRPDCPPLAAGLTVAIFHYLATEPVIERAIALEEQKHAAAGTTEMPIVSREVQRVGLFIGFLIYGMVWALLFGATYHFVQRWLPASGSVKARFVLALAGYWSVGLMPFCRYPANPPGVGDPDTIGYRQSLYLAFLALSIAGTALSLALGQYLGQRRGPGPGGILPALALLAGFSLVLFLVMPNNPDPVQMPIGLVTSFRALSLAGLTLFWAVLGFLFAMLLRQRPAERSLSQPRGAGA